MPQRALKGAGGSEGGCLMFLFGLSLAVLGVWLFFDSVRAETGHVGWISGAFRRRGGGMGTTTSMGVIFVPFFIGVLLLFYNSDLKIGWGLTGIGVLILAIEILSRIRFRMSMKTTHLLLLFIMIAGGLGLIIRSLRDKSLTGGSGKG